MRSRGKFIIRAVLKVNSKTIQQVDIKTYNALKNIQMVKPSRNPEVLKKEIIFKEKESSMKQKCKIDPSNIERAGFIGKGTGVQNLYTLILHYITPCPSAQ